VGTYKYDPDDLGDAVAGLGRLQSDYESASQVQEAAAGVFGYPGLAGAVEDFVDNWRHHRENQLETLSGTRESLQSITENYLEQDRAGAAELRDQAGG
jgi:hypothetical protein